MSFGARDICPRAPPCLRAHSKAVEAGPGRVRWQQHGSGGLPRACHQVGEKQDHWPARAPCVDVVGRRRRSLALLPCGSAINHSALARKALGLTREWLWSWVYGDRIAARSIVVGARSEIPVRLIGLGSPFMQATRGHDKRSRGLTRCVPRAWHDRITLPDGHSHWRIRFFHFSGRMIRNNFPSQELYRQPAAIPLPRAWPAQPRRNCPAKASCASFWHVKATSPGFEPRPLITSV